MPRASFKEASGNVGRSCDVDEIGIFVSGGGAPPCDAPERALVHLGLLGTHEGPHTGQGAAAFVAGARSSLDVLQRRLLSPESESVMYAAVAPPRQRTRAAQEDGISPPSVQASRSVQMVTDTTIATPQSSAAAPVIIAAASVPPDDAPAAGDGGGRGLGVDGGRGGEERSEEGVGPGTRYRYAVTLNTRVRFHFPRYSLMFLLDVSPSMHLVRGPRLHPTSAVAASPKSFALHHHATTPRSPPSQTPQQQQQLQRQTEGEEEEEEEERDSDASRSRGEAALQQQLSALFFAFSALLHDDSFAEGGLRHPNIQILVTVGVDGLLSTPLSLLVKDRLLTRDTLSGLRAELSAQLQRLLVRGPSSRLEGPHPASLPPVVHQTGTHSAASPDAPVGGGTGEPLSPARAAVRASAVAAPLAHSSSSSSSGGSTPSTSTTYRGTPEPRRLCLEAVVLNCLHVCTYGWMAGWMDGCVLCIWWNCFEFRVLKTHTANKVHKRSPLLRNVVSPRPLPLA
eukprot:GHVU01215233.1.p1 GENE.GHVU01215233.1~~GHVU01215233.1.p1  ORF type:complete len:511 (-),score=81.71 GHVU01215233.1:234-1766(-)